MNKALFSGSKIFRDLFIRCQRAIFWLVILSMVTNILMLAQPIYMLQIFSRVLTGFRTETLLYLTIIVIFVVASMNVLLWIRGRVLTEIGQWLSSQLARACLIRCPDQVLNGIEYGTQSLNDLNQLVGFISSPAMIAILDVPWSPIFLLVLFMIHPALGGLAVVGAAILVALSVVNEKATRLPYQEANVMFIKNRILMSSTLRNSETVQAMGMMDSVISHWAEREEEAKKIYAPAQHFSSMILSSTQFIRLTLQILILGLGAYLVISGSINPGGMIAASILLGRTLAPIENGINSWQILIKAQSAYKRLSAHLKTEERSGENYLDHKPKGLIEFKELHYRPPGSQKSVLENIHFTLEAGEILGVIGPSGAGKTTLARLMMGVYPPTVGGVSLDGIQTYTWNRADFGRHVGYLPQGIELFTGTVAQNIARMNEVDKDKVVTAAREAGIHDNILRFPQGYDTDVGEYGGALSGGIRQRIALARSLYDEPSLLVLDEPNSNLDDVGLAGLSKTLSKLKQKHKTVVLITHQRSLLKYADKIIYLNEGKILIYGPTKEVFQKLAEHQQSAQQKRKVNG